MFSCVIKHCGDEHCRHCRAACYRLGIRVIPVKSVYAAWKVTFQSRDDICIGVSTLEIAFNILYGKVKCISIQAINIFLDSEPIFHGNAVGYVRLVSALHSGTCRFQFLLTSANFDPSLVRLLPTVNCFPSSWHSSIKLCLSFQYPWFLKLNCWVVLIRHTRCQNASPLVHWSWRHRLRFWPLSDCKVPWKGGTEPHVLTLRYWITL